MLHGEEELADGLLVGDGRFHGGVTVVQRVLPRVEQEGEAQLARRVPLEHLLNSVWSIPRI